MRNKYRILALLYVPIFLIGALILGLAMIIKAIGAYIMLSPELAQSEINHLKKSLNL
ncbi:hypothetical protein CLV99_1015 [Sphingobacterium yanglingense]|uniref:Uncharacterized protein n=1 Tax=Sphingobacterium yanglingense TaxID=1437280 RepID=A0A4R6WH97_9SPHI|nr:hypothetical protein CLV99_1015 [Sphingobacterium yanglingense]